jgi:hypothetical protein
MLDVASRGQVMGQQLGLAFDEVGTSQRRNTEVRLTHRWRKADSNSPFRQNETMLEDRSFDLGWNLTLPRNRPTYHPVRETDGSTPGSSASARQKSLCSGRIR